MAVRAAGEAHREWSNWRFEDRAAIFLKAADPLASTWRDTLNGSSMLCQSKTIHQAEIDAACETIDFLRFNVFVRGADLFGAADVERRHYGNRLDYRPLEGFVYAVTPFNFTVDRREPVVGARRSWATLRTGSRPARRFIAAISWPGCSLKLPVCLPASSTLLPAMRPP